MYETYTEHHSVLGKVLATKITKMNETQSQMRERRSAKHYRQAKAVNTVTGMGGHRSPQNSLWLGPESEEASRVSKWLPLYVEYFQSHI